MASARCPERCVPSDVSGASCHGAIASMRRSMCRRSRRGGRRATRRRMSPTRFDDRAFPRVDAVRVRCPGRGRRGWCGCARRCGRGRICRRRGCGCGGGGGGARRNRTRRARGRRRSRDRRAGCGGLCAAACRRQRGRVPASLADRPFEQGLRAVTGRIDGECIGCVVPHATPHPLLHAGVRRAYKRIALEQPLQQILLHESRIGVVGLSGERFLERRLRARQIVCLQARARRLQAFGYIAMARERARGYRRHDRRHDGRHRDGSGGRRTGQRRQRWNGRYRWRGGGCLAPRRRCACHGCRRNRSDRSNALRRPRCRRALIWLDAAARGAGSRHVDGRIGPVFAKERIARKAERENKERQHESLAENPPARAAPDGLGHVERRNGRIGHHERLRVSGGLRDMGGHARRDVGWNRRVSRRMGSRFQPHAIGDGMTCAAPRTRFVRRIQRAAAPFAGCRERPAGTRLGGHAFNPPVIRGAFERHITDRRQGDPHLRDSRYFTVHRHWSAALPKRFRRSA